MRSGTERANRFMLILLGLQRLSYLAPVLLSVASPAYRSTALNAALFAGTLAWNVALFWRARRTGWFRPGMVWADVGWAVALLILVAANTPTASYGSLNWSTRFGQAATALAGAALPRVRVAAAAVGTVMAAHTVAILRWHEADDLVNDLVVCLNGLLWFGVIMGFGLRYLRRQGRLLDELTGRQVAAESVRAAEQARYVTRLAHYRTLHDTVLTTLTAIARGGLDHRAAQVRSRCSHEAGYIRRMLLEDPDIAPTGLADRLAVVITEAEALGLRIHHQHETPPIELSAEAVGAFGDAVREALNNVFNHAGVTAAWVTVTGTVDGVTVRVVDRGHGFDPETARPGFGLPYSIADRMRTAGGAARVTSAPGEGTCVELVWPA